MRKLLGDKKFYMMVMAITIPIMVQSGITNFVNLLDNMMVGQVGTDQMSGVAIVNQLLFVFNLCIFGGVSGAGIFTAQFYGQDNHDGVRETFRFKLIICAVVFLISLCLISTMGDRLILLYLHEDNGGGNLAATLQYAQGYMRIMLLGLIPFAISQAYSSTLRETGETILPMKAGIVAVLVNMVANYLLIFGKLGLPALGTNGAAIATVISRYVECGIVIAWTHKHGQRHRFIQGAYRQFKVQPALVKGILIKGTPLILNETVWAMGMAMLMQCYSIRGLSVVAGLNIASTISNLFNVVFLSLGSAVAIIVGPLLGAGKMKEAKQTAYQMILFSVLCCLGMGVLMAIMAPLFPAIYNTTAEVKKLATELIRIGAICMPMYGFLHATYFTLRSGGKTFITFLFDSVFLWVVSVPLAYMLSYYTGMPIVFIYLICQLADLLKCGIGYILLKKGVWLENIVESKARPTQAF